MPTSDPRQRRRTLRARLKARAYDLVAAVAGRRLARPVTVTATDGEVRVQVTVGPADGPPGPATGRPPDVYGRFLSSAEAAVVQALIAAGALPADGAPSLLGKQVAARLGRDYDSTFKNLLSNLDERQVINHTPNEGYRLAGANPPAD